MAKKPAKKKPVRRVAKKPPKKSGKKAPKVRSAKKMTKAPRAKARMKPKAIAKPAAARQGPSWFDADSHKPLIGKYAGRLDSFVKAIADGKIDDRELQAQEKRLIASMKKVEPALSGSQHEAVTELLCELTAYDVMQMLHAMQSSRPKATFRG